VIVIAKNDEDIIGDCLESVKWAGEIIVLDTGSTDETIEIAKKYTPKVSQYPQSKEEINFSAWRNYALRQASGEWLLFVDTDERVTPLLRKEIESAISYQLTANSKLSAFAIPRRNIRLGKEMHYGGWWPDYVLRLMKKEALKGWQGELHEQPIIEGKIGNLSEPFIHYSHRGSFEDKLANTIVWSGLEAELLFKANHPPMNLKRFLGAMGREFNFRMIKSQAWRDGTEGILEAIYQVFSVFITYARLWEKQQKN